jgi:hypothetical protein
LQGFFVASPPFFAAFFRFTPPVLASNWRADMSTKQAKNESDFCYDQTITAWKKDMVLF